jgi:hypothetical protein
MPPVVMYFVAVASTLEGESYSAKKVFRAFKNQEIFAICRSLGFPPSPAQRME